MSKIFITFCLIVCILIAGCTSSTEHKVSTNPIVGSKDVLHVKYFMKQNCSACDKTKDLLVNLSARYPGKLEIKYYDITDNSTNREEFLKYSRDIKIKTVPFIVINERNIFENYNEIMTNLEPSIAGTKRLI